MNNQGISWFSAAQVRWLVDKDSILPLWKLVMLLKLVATAGPVNFLHQQSLYKIPS